MPEPARRSRATLRFDAVVEEKIHKNWNHETLRAKLTDEFDCDALYRGATLFVAGTPRPAFCLVTSARF